MGGGSETSLREEKLVVLVDHDLLVLEMNSSDASRLNLHTLRLGGGPGSGSRSCASGSLVLSNLNGGVVDVTPRGGAGGEGAKLAAVIKLLGVIRLIAHCIFLSCNNIG